MVQKGQGELQKNVQEMTRKACDWIEFDISSYNISMKAIMEDKDKEKAQAIRELDEQVKQLVEDKEITQDKATILKACKMKLIKDMELQKKMLAFKKNAT